MTLLPRLILFQGDDGAGGATRLNSRSGESFLW